MKRRLFNILSALSLLVFVAMVVLWISSMWVVTGCGYWVGESYFDVWSAHGCMKVEKPTVFTVLPLSGFYYIPANAFGNAFRWDYLGFDGNRQNLTIPDWFICSITAVLPCLWYRSYRRRRLAERKGHCPNCGYDLRASKERCPECGTTIPVQTASSAKT